MKIYFSGVKFRSASAAVLQKKECVFSLDVASPAPSPNSHPLPFIHSFPTQDAHAANMKERESERRRRRREKTFPQIYARDLTPTQPGISQLPTASTPVDQGILCSSKTSIMGFTRLWNGDMFGRVRRFASPKRLSLAEIVSIRLKGRERERERRETFYF